MKNFNKIFSLMLSMFIGFMLMTSTITAEPPDIQAEPYSISPDIVFQSAVEALPDLSKDTGDERIIKPLAAIAKKYSFFEERFKSYLEFQSDYKSFESAIYENPDLQEFFLVPWQNYRS